MKYELAYNRPDDAGGEDVEDNAEQNQKTDMKIPEDLSGFLKSRGLDPQDPKSLLAIWESRGVEVKNAKDFRKRAQEAEAKAQKGQKLHLGEMLQRLEDDDRKAVEELLGRAEGQSHQEEALNMIAESGIKMTPEVLDLVKAGPAATKAYLAALQNANVAKADVSLDETIEKAIRRITGVGADQTQRDQSKKTDKKSILEELQGPRTRTHDILDALKAGSEKSMFIKE